MFYIEYEVLNSGWAKVKISSLEVDVDFMASYLNDSLKELAQSAIKIQSNTSATIIFISEPDGYILNLNRENLIINYELKWFSEYSNIGYFNEKNKTILKGTITVVKYVNQIRNILTQISDKMSPETYKEKWIMHEFPLEELKVLK